MKLQKRIGIFLMTLVMTAFANAQDKKASPAETVTGKINGATITINYGSPSVKRKSYLGRTCSFWRSVACQS
jgi:hypothetical protein